jgi:hypothetical protein
MNEKSKFLVYLLIAVMLMLQVLPVSAQGETPPTVEITISDTSSNEDMNWPILKQETHRRKDPSTGTDIVETIVIKRKPLTKENIECENKSKNKSKNGQSELNSAVILASDYCVLFTSSITASATRTVGGGTVTGYAKNFAAQYCNSAGVCDFVKMNRLEVYWTRTSTSFGLINARTAWGCIGGGCWLCPGPALTYYKYVSGYFTPTWNGLRTSTYVYTSSMPIMMTSFENGGIPAGGNDATATAPRSAVPLSVYASFVNP